jgi:glycosyltransferase involved in cell wall biosynthesis
VSGADVPLEVLNVDLTAALPEPGKSLQADGWFCVLWWRDVPLGQVTLGNADLPPGKHHFAHLVARAVAPAVGHVLFREGFGASLPELPLVERGLGHQELQALIDLERPLEHLDHQKALPTGERLSVVVCTRDRPHYLRRCLLSLTSAFPAPDEIIVVDNAPSTDETRKLVMQNPKIRYVLEPRPGLDRARNRGAVTAAGDIVAFIDDDATVHRAWAAAIRAGFRDDEVKAVAGLVLPAALDTKAQLLFEQHWGFGRGYRALRYDAAYFERLKWRGVPAWYVGAGTNMAFRREVFDEVGLFDELLDVGAAGCSGDSEMWYRLLAAGMVCLYSPRAVAFHLHRRELPELSRQLHYYMRGHTAALCTQFARHLHWGNLVRLCVILPAYYLRCLLAGIAHGFRARYQFLGAEITGCLSGIWYFVRHLHSWEKSCPRPGDARFAEAPPAAGDAKREQQT